MLSTPLQFQHWDPNAANAKSDSGFAVGSQADIKIWLLSLLGLMGAFPLRPDLLVATQTWYNPWPWLPGCLADLLCPLVWPPGPLIFQQFKDSESNWSLYHLKQWEDIVTFVEQPSTHLRSSKTGNVSFTLFCLLLLILFAFLLLILSCYSCNNVCSCMNITLTLMIAIVFDRTYTHPPHLNQSWQRIVIF